MTRKEIIDGLKFTIDMFLFDPMSGETLTVPKSNMDKITIDACKGAIEVLEQETKTGYWIEYECDEDKYDKIECSKCRQSFIVDSYHWCDIGFTKDDLMYCPNCGQPKMQEVEE